MRLEPAPPVPHAQVALRPIEAADAAAWYAYLSLPSVTEHTSWALAGPDDLVRAIAGIESDAPDSPVRYAIVDRDTGALCGTIGLPTISWVHRTAEVAYDLAPAFAGRGTMSACCRALTDWLFDAHGFTRVEATALDTNVASQRVLDKSGFAFEGVARNLKRVRGRPRDFRRYARIPEDA